MRVVDETMYEKVERVWRYVPLMKGLEEIRFEPNAYRDVIDMVTHRGHGKARLFFVGNGMRTVRTYPDIGDEIHTRGHG